MTPHTQQLLGGKLTTGCSLCSVFSDACYVGNVFSLPIEKKDENTIGFSVRTILSLFSVNRDSEAVKTGRNWHRVRILSFYRNRTLPVPRFFVLRSQWILSPHTPVTKREKWTNPEICDIWIYTWIFLRWEVSARTASV